MLHNGEFLFELHDMSPGSTSMEVLLVLFRLDAMFWKLRLGEFMPEKLSYSREAATQIEHATGREVSWREMCSDLLGSIDIGLLKHCQRR